MKSSGMQTSLKDYFTFKSSSKKGTPSSEIKRESTITPMPAKAMPPKQSNDKSSVLNSLPVDTIKKMQNADASAGFNYFQRQKQPKRNYEQVLLDGDEDMKQHQLFREEKGKSNCAGYEEVKLSDEQQHVLDLVVNQGKSVFFTGNAGAGKSFLLREIIKQLKRIKSGEALQICASTGIAACNIGGKTLHSFVGCGIVRMHPSQMAGRVIKNKSALARWQITEVLIIDEISMIDGDLFDSIDQCARIVRDSKKPFGGIQLVICGDFFQLPPVPERDSNGKMIAPTFCFETESWKNAIEETVMLTHTFRQTDPVFINILNELRFNKLSAESIKVLKSLNRPVKIGDFCNLPLE
jgi:ATP-dependent DNA helicase PIF1